MLSQHSIFFVNTRSGDNKQFSHDTEEAARFAATESVKMGQKYGSIAERREMKTYRCDFCNAELAMRKFDGKDTCIKCNPSAYTK